MNQEKLQEIECDIQALKERNTRVEADKAWETSIMRKFSICVITYIIASAVMWAIGVGKVYLNALIPTIGYFLSTQSIPVVKKWWIGKYMHKQ